MPAWLLSVVVHLLTLVVLALIVRVAPRRAPDEQDRRVGIVLARHNADQSNDYFDDAESHSAAASSTTLAGENSADDFAAALPELPPPVPGIQLPQRPSDWVGSSVSDHLVVSPQYSGKPRGPILPGVGDEQILAEDAAFRARQDKGPLGPPARVSLFGGSEAIGHRFVFVVDRSQSMGGEGLGAIFAAERELKAAVARLEPNHQFQIIAYHHSPVYVGQRKLLPATPENKQLLPEYFAGLATFGGTVHETALLAALRLKPDVVFLLTDGGDPPLNERQIAEITERAGGAVSIHCIQFGFGAPPGDNFMTRLARQNRGSYGYVDMSQSGR